MLDYYFPETIRNIENSLVSLFDNTFVYKFDRQKRKLKEIKVPIIIQHFKKAYISRKEKETGKKYYPELPRINLAFRGLAYSSDRATSQEDERFFNEADIHYKDEGVDGEILKEINGIFRDEQPKPWNFNYTVTITCDSMRNLSQILESTLPNFTPRYTQLRMKEFSFLNLERDIPVNMGGVSLDISEDLSSEETREIKCTFDLEVEGFLYKPVHGSYLIKTINTKYFDENHAELTEIELAGYLTEEEIPPDDYQSITHNGVAFVTEKDITYE
jgi:hypothetical protein